MVRRLRSAYLAGQWYPKDERACRAAVESHAAQTAPEQGSWRGLVGPHAGWTYSGDAAAKAYRWLAENNPNPDLVVVFGSHRGPQGPNSIFKGDAWSTPLGDLTCAHDVVRALSDDLQLAEEPVAPRHPDNAVELHLPFVRYFFPQAELLMLGVEAGPKAIDIGEAVAARVAEHERNAVFIASTDLTHYGPNYRFEPHGPAMGPESHGASWVRHENDRGFIDRVLAWDARGALEHATTHHSACCPGAVAACLAALPQGQPKLVDHYLSCDVRPSSSFVGYAGILL